MRTQTVTGIAVALAITTITVVVGAADDQGATPPCLTCIGQASAADLTSQRELSSARDQAAAREVVPLQMQVVISKYQGDKKISSLPYMMSFNTTNVPENRPGSIRMGTQIAIPSTSTVEGKTTTSYNYKDVGTSIDAGATARPDGAFNVFITVSDSSVYTDDQPKTSAGVATVGGMPVIRSYQTTNRVVLKDGQTSQFTAATDRVSGEVVKIDVTLKVVK
jgi:hypothetical protein